MGEAERLVISGKSLRLSAAGGNSTVCPSFACLDVKMYSFLNSQSCICSVGDLERLRDLGVAAVAHLKVALIGACRSVLWIFYLDSHLKVALIGAPLSRWHGYLTLTVT